MTDLSDRRGRNRFYNSAPWRRLRDWHLRRHPLCVVCERLGFAVAATDLDHIQSLAEHPDLALTESNLQSLCRPCHTAKTRSETTGRKPKHWSDGACDIAGFPLSPNHPWNRERGDE
jgi:5-methylcytosine-specific restriction protein A